MKNMHTNEPGCDDDVLSKDKGSTESDNATAGTPQQSVTADQKAAVDSVRALTDSDTVEPTKEDLLRTSAKLEAVVPDGYQAWRLQADFLLAAIRQLETRQVEPDGSVKVIGVPLLENDLRAAAETALRNCAHFAQTVEQHVALIDEANRVRTMTWF